MHDGGELSAEMGLDVSSPVFYSRSNGILGSKWCIDDDSEVFNLEVCLI